MEQVCFALPILPGRTDSAQAFFTELETERKGEYAASERRIGVDAESWYLQRTPQGDLLVASVAGPDLAVALAMFAQSNDAFDQWFKRRLAEVTGVDLNSPPPWPLSEELSSYAAAGVQAG